MKTKDQVLIESMFKYADNGIDPCILTENVNYSSVLVEASGDAASLFSRLNDGRKELMKSVQNIDWKEWVKKMKETVMKIIRFITAPARTAKDLVTGRTTLKEVGQRLKQVWSNLKAKKNKTPEEKVAEDAISKISADVEKATANADEAIEKLDSSGNTETEQHGSNNPAAREIANSIVKRAKDELAEEQATNEEKEEYKNKVNELKMVLKEAEQSRRSLNPIFEEIDTTFASEPNAAEIIKAEYDKFKDSDEILDLDNTHIKLYIKICRTGGGSSTAIKYVDEVYKPIENINDNFAKYSTIVNVKSTIAKVYEIRRELNYIWKYLDEIDTRINKWL